MKYYIRNDKKVDFYLLGEEVDGKFTKGHGLEFLEQFPYLMDEIEFIDDGGDTIGTDDFFKMINKSEKSSEKELVIKEIKHIETQLSMGKSGNRNHLDGWATQGMENKLKTLNGRLSSL